jgi:hypothetical protein
MEETKKCDACNRFYRGEGHKGHCTVNCFCISEYKRKHGDVPRNPKPLYQRPVKKNDPIKAANDRWLKEKVVDKEKEKRMRRGREKYVIGSLYNDDRVSKRFRVMRG